MNHQDQSKQNLSQWKQSQGLWKQNRGLWKQSQDLWNLSLQKDQRPVMIEIRIIGVTRIEKMIVKEEEWVQTLELDRSVHSKIFLFTSQEAFAEKAKNITKSYLKYFRTHPQFT